MQGLANVLVLATALLVAVDTVWTRFTNRRVKQTHDNVEQLKNGMIKEKVREALTEHDKEQR